CDPQTVAEVVQRTLQEICIDRTVFSVDELIFARSSTLFECISAPVTQSVAAILAAMQDNLRALIGRCCTVYAVPRMRPESFHLRDADIHVIARGDPTAWQHLVDEGFLFDGWTPEDPRPG